MSLEACPGTDSETNLSPMSTRAPRPSVGLTDADAENIERLLDAIPFLRSLKRAALLLYLVRVGMDVLAENPLRALEAAPTPERLAAQIEDAKARIMAARGRRAEPMGNTTLRAGMESDARLPTGHPEGATPSSSSPPSGSAPTKLDPKSDVKIRKKPGAPSKKGSGKDLTREASDAELQRGRRASGLTDERPR